MTTTTTHLMSVADIFELSSMSQRALADTLDVHYNTVNNWVKGEGEPTFTQYAQLVEHALQYLDWEVLDLDPDELLLRSHSSNTLIPEYSLKHLDELEPALEQYLTEAILSGQLVHAHDFSLETFIDKALNRNVFHSQSSWDMTHYTPIRGNTYTISNVIEFGLIAPAELRKIVPAEVDIDTFLDRILLDDLSPEEMKWCEAITDLVEKKFEYYYIDVVNA